VSATAAPIANSSGSVTNQAIQVLQGPYITNTYGGGIQCQGSTMNITPYITGSASQAKPNEQWWDSPVYDMRDLDEDGAPDNPGHILYTVPTRTGQKDNYSLGVGISATWSIPLDKKLQDQCKQAVNTQISMQKQLTANKRLDFEIARLKNCGELMKAGISFRPGSAYAKVCEDVMVDDITYIREHIHSIPQATPSKDSTTPSNDLSKSESPDSSASVPAEYPPADAPPAAEAVAAGADPAAVVPPPPSNSASESASPLPPCLFEKTLSFFNSKKVNKPTITNKITINNSTYFTLP